MSLLDYHSSSKTFETYFSDIVIPKEQIQFWNFVGIIYDRKWK